MVDDRCGQVNRSATRRVAAEESSGRGTSRVVFGSSWTALGVVALVLVATAATAGPLEAFRNSDLPRPIRAALGVWSLVGLVLIHFAVCAGIIGWSHLVRAVTPHRLKRIREHVEIRPFSCFLLGLVNAVVVIVLMRVAYRPGAILLGVLLLFGAVTGLAGILESLGMRLSQPTAEDPSIHPGAALWRGGIALALATVIPLLGQVLAIVVFLIGLGAATLSLFSSGPPYAAKPETDPATDVE